ncbi:MAG: hypothetical protein WBJ75_04895 [Pseudohongiellaceae bacterium]
MMALSMFLQSLSTQSVSMTVAMAAAMSAARSAAARRRARARNAQQPEMPETL